MLRVCQQPESAVGTHERPDMAWLVAAYERDGRSAIDIAAQLREESKSSWPTSRTVLRWLHAAGATVRTAHADRNRAADVPVDADELRRLYVDEGLSSYALGRRYGVSSSTVLSWLSKVGVSPRPPRVPRVAGTRPVTWMVAKRKAGWTYQQIADVVGVSRETVRQRIQPLE